MLFQSLYFGTLTGLILGSLLFTFICRWDRKVKLVESVVKQITNAEATKYLLATIIFFLTIFGSSLIYEAIYNIWIQVTLTDKIALIRVVSNFVLSSVIGVITIYIAYQQYRLARIKSNYDTNKLINKTFYGRAGSSPQSGKTLNLLIFKTNNYSYVAFYNHQNQDC